jgi:hypothetical protein
MLEISIKYATIENMKKINLKSVFLIVTFASLAGCATAAKKSASAGNIGCDEDDVTISDEKQPFMGGVASWKATCKGKVFFCSAVSGGQNGGATVNCKEALK